MTDAGKENVFISRKTSAFHSNFSEGIHSIPGKYRDQGMKQEKQIG